MKFFSWNIRQGGGSRIEKIIAELECHANADLIILIELLKEYRQSLISEVVTVKLKVIIDD